METDQEMKAGPELFETYSLELVLCQYQCLLMQNMNLLSTTKPECLPDNTEICVGSKEVLENLDRYLWMK